MKHCFTRETRNGSLLRNTCGKVHRVVLLALLLVAAGIAYVYYFTGISGSGGEPATDISHTSLVKKPIPPRLENTASAPEESNPRQQPAGSSSAEPAEKTVAMQQARIESGGAEKIAPAREAAPIQRKAASPSKQQSPETAQTGIKRASSSHAKEQAMNKAAPEAKKPAVKSKETGTEKTTAKAFAKPEKGSYTLQIGVYVTNRSLTSEKKKLRSAGLHPVVTNGPRKTETMNRLFMGEYASYAEAAVAMQKLKKVSGDAFVLPENEKYALYAGSYYMEERAVKLRDNLTAAGYKPLIRKTSVPISTFRLTAGEFGTKSAAEQKARSLKQQGIEAAVVRTGK